jgi:DNA-binding GntR family transcriptional regulator
MTKATRPTRSEELVHRLEEEIFDGRLKPGTRLDEQELAQRFKVSRTPVREAIRHLVSSGLVAQRRHQGAVVKALTITELFEMFQVMAELEGLCARLAARRMTADERKRMLAVHQQCLGRLQAGDHVGFFESNNELHDVISAGSHNRFLDEKTQELRKRVNPYRYIITYQPGRMGDSDDEHEAVIQAIESHDGEEAHRLMRDHVNLLGESAADAIALLRADGAMDDESESRDAR